MNLCTADVIDVKNIKKWNIFSSFGQISQVSSIFHLIITVIYKYSVTQAYWLEAQTNIPSEVLFFKIEIY
jgi:hypothetical protein